jgi:hypothetical protein
MATEDVVPEARRCRPGETAHCGVHRPARFLFLPLLVGGFATPAVRAQPPPTEIRPVPVVTQSTLDHARGFVATSKR